MKGASIQYAATNEDDIDEDKILEKLSKITTDYKLLKGTVSDKPTVDKTPSPLVERPSPVFAPAPPKSFSPAPPTSPPPATVEKPKTYSPSKVVSPFLNNNNAADSPSSPTSPPPANKNGSSGEPSHVNKVRAMFNNSQSSAAAEGGPAKPLRSFNKINQQKAMFERGMLGEEATIKISKPIDIQKEIEEAQQQQKLNQPPTLSADVEFSEEPALELAEPKQQQHTNGSQPEVLAEEQPTELKPTSPELIVPEEQIVEQQVPNEVYEEEEFIDPEQTLKARALYDYQAGEIVAFFNSTRLQLINTFTLLFQPMRLK